MLPILACAALCLAGVGCILHGIAIFRLRRHLAAAPPESAETPPLTIWRALKVGVPDLGAKLEALITATRPGDQILVGVDHYSHERPACRAWAEKYPEREIAIVDCHPGHSANPKISKFLQMQPAARHEHWLLTDSESILTRDFVEAIRSEWAQGGADVVTAGYRFEGARTVSQLFDTLPAAITLWPGLMLVRRIKFTLGACTGVRGTDLERVGGWAALTNHLAEDHELGRRLARDGKRIALAHAVLTLDSDPLTWGDFFRHQHRVAVTYRSANPAGSLGLPILHVTGLAGLAILLLPQLWPIAGVLIAIRTALAIVQLRTLKMRAGPVAWLAALFVPCFETIFWLMSWFPLPVWWANRWRRTTLRGHLVDPTVPTPR